MNIYERSATVEAQGEVRVAGVPFAPGTEVEVTISPKVRSGAGDTRRRRGLVRSPRADARVVPHHQGVP